MQCNVIQSDINDMRGFKFIQNFHSYVCTYIHGYASQCLTVMENLVKDELKEQGGQDKTDILHKGTYCRMSRRSALASSTGDHEYCHHQS